MSPIINIYIYSNIHLLYCLRCDNYILVTLVYKFFVVKLIVVLAFFIHLMIIGLDFYSFVFFLVEKIQKL